MAKRIYEITDMPNGLKMAAILPINDTGIAEAYFTIRENPIGYSKGHCGPYSCNIYKDYELKDGIRDFKLACDALGVSDRSVITNRLTAFTNIVREVDRSNLIGYDIYDEPNAPRADGLITGDSAVTLYNYAADCSIIMFCSPKYRLVGSLHASWKGSLIGIIENEVQAIAKRTNGDLSDVIAVVMPSISLENFEVGADCAEQFINAGFAEAVDLTNYEKPHVNLSGVNKSILLKIGLHQENVYVIDDLCTMRDAHLFHSYRRGPIRADGTHLNGMNGYFIKLK